jgi:hypothetical protein
LSGQLTHCNEHQWTIIVGLPRWAQLDCPHILAHSDKGRGRMINIATSHSAVCPALFAPFPGLISSTTRSMLKQQLTLPGKNRSSTVLRQQKLPQEAPGLSKVSWLQGRNEPWPADSRKMIRDASNAGARLARLAVEQKTRCQDGPSKCRIALNLRWALCVELSRSCDPG